MYCGLKMRLVRRKTAGASTAMVTPLRKRPRTRTTSIEHRRQENELDCGRGPVGPTRDARGVGEGLAQVRQPGPVQREVGERLADDRTAALDRVRSEDVVRTPGEERNREEGERRSRRDRGRDRLAEPAQSASQATRARSASAGVHLTAAPRPRSTPARTKRSRRASTIPQTEMPPPPGRT